MQNKPNNNIKALEAMISDTEATDIASNLETILMGYLTTDFYCQSHEKERHNFIFATTQTINLFRYLSPTGSKESQDDLNNFLEAIQPEQAVSVWNEAIFGYVGQDSFCERNELERWSLIHIARLVIDYFKSL